MLEKQINLINENIGVLSFGSVLSNSVKNGVKNYKHSNRHKLFTEVKNIIANKAVVGIYIRLLRKGVQRTVSK